MMTGSWKMINNQGSWEPSSVYQEVKKFQDSRESSSLGKTHAYFQENWEMK
jgi:hypothetical protein